MLDTLQRALSADGIRTVLEKLPTDYARLFPRARFRRIHYGAGY